MQGSAYSVTFQCPETGITGARETAVALGLDTENIDAAAVRANADDPRWDAEFTDHPLYRLRRHMQRFESTLLIKDANLTTAITVFKIFKKEKSTLAVTDTTNNFSERIVNKGEGFYLEKGYPSLEEAILFSRTLVAENEADIYFVIDEHGFRRETIMDSDFQRAKAIKQERHARIVGILIVVFFSAVILFINLSLAPARLSLCALTALHVVLSYGLDFDVVVAAIAPSVVAILLVTFL